jgi:hypothetical protein
MGLVEQDNSKTADATVFSADFAAPRKTSRRVYPGGPHLIDNARSLV